MNELSKPRLSINRKNNNLLSFDEQTSFFEIEEPSNPTIKIISFYRVSSSPSILAIASLASQTPSPVPIITVSTAGKTTTDLPPLGLPALTSTDPLLVITMKIKIV